jgi:hypothetical protein
LSCCEECHFAGEEREAVPYLAPDEQATLRLDHLVLRVMPEGTRRTREVRRHARWEDRIFRERLPPALAARFLAEHIALRVL